MVCVSGKSFRHEGLECGGLSHATIADFLEQSLRVVFMHAKKKRGRRGGSTVKKMLGIWLVEAMR